MFAYPSNWSSAADNIPWAYIIGMYVLFGIWLVWLLVLEPRRWTKVAEIDGWEYYELKKNPKKRRCLRSNKIIPANKAWLKGETDTL
jgi:hypothetical protein